MAEISSEGVCTVRGADAERAVVTGRADGEAGVGAVEG